MELHANAIATVLNEQMELCEAAPEGDMIPGYLRNMGVCPDCVMVIAMEYCGALREQHANEDIGEVVFLRAFTVGLVLGRQNPTVVG